MNKPEDNIIYLSKSEINNLELSNEPVLYLVTNKKIFNQIKKIFNNYQNPTIIIQNKNNKKEFTKKIFLLGFRDLLNQKILPNHYEKEYKKLYNKLNGKLFFEKNKKITYNINNQDIKIKLKDIYEVLTSSEDNFRKIMNQEKILDIPKKFFFFLVIKYIRENKIIDNYNLPHEFYDNYYILSEKINSISDILADDFMKNHFEDKDNVLSEIKLNEDFKKEILNKIPTNYDKLEQAIYVYIQLCRTLTYEEEYLFTKDTYLMGFNHRNKYTIEGINKEKNKVLCSSFTFIFAKFLESLGIEYIIQGIDDGHTYLFFRIEDLLIKADSTTTAVEGDLASLKYSNKVKGLSLYNKNITNEKYLKENNKLKEKINEIVSHIVEEENLTFDKILTKYKEKNKKEIAISIEDKLRILLEKAQKCEFSPVDKYSYIESIAFKSIFANNRYNIDTFIVKNNQTNKVQTLIVYNEENINNYEKSWYYIIDDDKCIAYNYNELKELFDKAIYMEMIHDMNAPISEYITGISTKKGEEYAEEVKRTM